jgi:hypothetical protein
MLEDTTASDARRSPRRVPSRGSSVSGEAGPVGARRQGRPRGSVSLTDEIQETIVSFTRAGAMPHVAATAAGISTRTLQDWLERGEDRHPHRSSTPKLKAFAGAVRGAQAEARLALEVRVYREQPKFWLTHAARSRSQYEGWTEPIRDQAAERESGILIQQWLGEMEDEDEQRRTEHEAVCADASCIAQLHRRSNGIHAANIRCDDPDHPRPNH